MNAQFFGFIYIIAGAGLFYAIMKFSNIYALNKKIKFVDGPLLEPKIIIRKDRIVALTKELAHAKRTVIEVKDLVKKICSAAGYTCIEKRINEEFTYVVHNMYDNPKVAYNGYLVDLEHAKQDIAEKFEYEKRLLSDNQKDPNNFIIGCSIFSEKNSSSDSVGMKTVLCFNALDAEHIFSRLCRMDERSGMVLFLALTERMVVENAFLH